MVQVWRGDGLAGAGLGCVRVSVPSMRDDGDLSLLLGVTHFHSQYPGDDVSTLLQMIMTISPSQLSTQNLRESDMLLS